MHKHEEEEEEIKPVKDRKSPWKIECFLED